MSGVCQDKGAKVENIFKDKILMITGGTGSFGKGRLLETDYIKKELGL